MPFVAAPDGEVVLEGVPVSPGIVCAPAYVYAREDETVEERRVAPEEAPAERRRFEQAVERAERDLGKVTTLAREKLGDEHASIFEAQALMLRDPSLFDAVVEAIENEHVGADYAVHRILSRHSELMLAADGEHFRERAADLTDLEQRLLVHLRRGKMISLVDEGAIVVAPSLTAADIVLFARRGIKGVALQYGGATSHVSIMARALGLPAVVGLKDVTRHVTHGEQIVLDGLRGRVIAEPQPQTVKFYEERRRRYARLLSEQRKLVPLASVTQDGHRVTLRANLEFEEELELLARYGAEGVGLFRTEILMLMRRRLSLSEEEQFLIYKGIAASVGEGGTTFRVLDLGGDKMLPVAHREANPFLGWRGVRVLLDKPDLAIPQLRAILRASAFGIVRLLIPMVTNVDEVRSFRGLILETTARLRAEGHAVADHVPVGIMVEVPAVALMAERFAPYVDFFSIGSNDLTQYTLAVDRGNDLVAKLFDELNPAVLRLIAQTIQAGHAAGIKVSLCGEMAANPVATPILLGLGLDEFSLSPVYLPDVKQIVRSIRLTEAQELARACLKAADGEEVHALSEAFLEDHGSPYLQMLEE